MAQRFEVSKRTINRDIEEICKAGIPLVTKQGWQGGISIADGYKLNTMYLTKDELQTIFSGLKSIDSISKTSYTHKLMEKLSVGRQHFISTGDQIIINLASHYKDILIPKIEFIKKAIQEQVLITFSYYYNKGEAVKRIEPYFIVFQWASWYLYGFCLDRNDYRMFKLNRLWNLQCTNKPFISRDIDQNSLQFEDYFTDEIHLTALFQEEVKYKLIEEYGLNCYTTLENGRLFFQCNFTNHDDLLAWVLRFGDNIEVVEPVELRDEIIQHAENILKQYKAR